MVPFKFVHFFSYIFSWSRVGNAIIKYNSYRMKNWCMSPTRVFKISDFVRFGHAFYTNPGNPIFRLPRLRGMLSRYLLNALRERELARKFCDDDTKSIDFYPLSVIISFIKFVYSIATRSHFKIEIGNFTN